mmetsp:Transcript_30062/g.60387  ORF Transcript_30062/g.60387 Transcript_30062/m.60387 type:complete len:306 (+) Transcript_30062:168-1085(+)
MKNNNLKNTAILLAVTVNQSTAFLPPSPPQLTTTTTTLYSTASPEQLYPQLLNSASLCANSESCSIESAELYLREIIHVQAGCAAGSTMAAGNEEVCSDVGRTSEVLAGLREKIRKGAVKENAAFWESRQQEFETLLTSSLDPTTNQLSPTAALTQAPLKPTYLALAALYTIFVISTLNPPMIDADTAVGGVVPFTAQEVWWAIRDGYIGDLTSHLLRNGGLVVGDTTANAAANVASSLTPQEVWWSIRDGYADNTLFANGVDLGVENGGGGVVPLKPQEVYWAVRDGYVGDLIGHWFRNGGLSV